MSSNTIIPDKTSSWKMFDRIAKTYDPLNRILSLGIDQMWRRKLARRIPDKDALSLLDLATGTGDQLFMLCRENRTITKAIGMDLSEEMMEIAKQKQILQEKQILQKKQEKQEISFLTGDAQNIPLEDEQFDAISISFGIRNVPDVPKALKEMYRVSKPNGKLLILEFGVPKNKWFKQAYLTYFRHILPTIGGWVSGEKQAYQYLNHTVEDFPYGEAFCQWMQDAGFTNVSATPLHFGIAYLYEGEKQGEVA